MRVIENTIPLLGVSNMEESIEFYTDKLEFKFDWQDETLSSLSKDGNTIMLSSREDMVKGSWIWMGLHTETYMLSLLDKNIDVLQQPTNQPWAFEMKIKDPDGNVLWLAAAPREDH